MKKLIFLILFLAIPSLSMAGTCSPLSYTCAEMDALFDLITGTLMNTDEAGEINGLDAVDPASDDIVVIEDQSDSWNKKKVTVGNISGSRVITKSTATDYTIGTTSSLEVYGGIIYVSGAATITIPAVGVQQNFTVVTIGNVAVSVDPNGSDRIILDGTALSDGDKATNTSSSGDVLTCAYESADGWYCGSGSNDGDLWTDGN